MAWQTSCSFISLFPSIATFKPATTTLPSSATTTPPRILDLLPCSGHAYEPPSLSTVTTRRKPHHPPPTSAAPFYSGFTRAPAIRWAWSQAPLLLFLATPPCTTVFHHTTTTTDTSSLGPLPPESTTTTVDTPPPWPSSFGQLVTVDLHHLSMHRQPPSLATLATVGQPPILLVSSLTTIAPPANNHLGATISRVSLFLLDAPSLTASQPLLNLS